jgi:signal transduction histidine kinase
MSLPPRLLPAPAPSRDRLPLGWLPRGRELPGLDFAWRHRVVCAVVAAHVPVLLLLTLLRGRGVAAGLGGTALAGALLAVALLPLRRRLRSCAATLALLSCSAVLVHVFDGTPEMHFHYFVAVAVVALYQDWVTYALAIAFVALQHGLIGLVDEGSLYPHSGRPWVWALVHAGFVLAESSVLVLFWRANEQARQREERARSELVETQTSVQARIAETERIRTDLIGTVSHEFRTPLTGIRGATLTLLKRGGRLDDARREQLLRAVLEQQERLSRLLENMLTAARATAADPAAVAEVDGVAAEVAMLAGARSEQFPAPSVVVEPGTVARIDRPALHQVLANLIDNAQQHGTPGAVPVVAGGYEDNGDGVWISVSNEGQPLDERSTARLFEPFTQADSGPTRNREGLGMGLYVVRRLIEVYGGGVSARSEGGWVTVEVHLRAAAGAAASARLPGRARALAG